ncbi:MAG: S8 family peptidase, partial [Thermoplasmatales archaeon]|nr:S8 family peptidase [Thermoplasmatales archaeon]
PHTDGGFDGNQTDWSDTIRAIKGGAGCDFEVYGIFEAPDVDHPAFEKATRAEYIGDSSTGSASWHATTTLGIAIASQEADSGDAMGQAPDAHWCTLLSSNIPAGAAKMVSEGGVCLSASWGPNPSAVPPPDPAGDYGTYAKAVDDAATSGTGGDGKVLMFWSGGNDPVAPDSQAAAKDIMCIGGSDIKGTGARSDDTYGSGACVGYMVDKMVKPDMAFSYMGEDYDVCNNSLTPPYEWNIGYVGTSYSSPAAAGIGTVYVDMWNANHFGNYPTALPSAACLKALMISDGYFMDLATKASRKQQGWGEVNAKRAYELGDAHYIFDEGTALSTGGTWSKTVNALDTSTFETGLTGLRISLVWTDPSGDPAAAKALVNDLDLEVTGSGGTYYGNRGLDTSLWNALGSGTNYWSDAADNYDDCNNVENVFIASPSGNYEITVTAASTVSAQKFALVVSGVVAGTGVPFWKDQTRFKTLNVKATTVQVSDSNLTGTPNSDITIESIPASRVEIYSETDKTPINIG